MEQEIKGQELLHTPGGVRDIYGMECARKLAVEKGVQGVRKCLSFLTVGTIHWCCALM